MKFYVLLLLAIYVVGCVGKPEKAYLLDSTNIEDMTNRKFDLSAQVRDWDYVVLEQNDSCCLTNIGRLKIVGDDVFVVNVEAMQSDIYRFSIDGKFLNKIGQQGRDFGLVTNVVVDTFNNRVCLLDIIDRCVYLYDYDGKRVNGKIACPWVGWVMDAVACSKDEFIGYYGFNKNNHVGYFRMDSLFTMRDTLSYYPVSSEFAGVLNFSMHAMDAYDGNMLLIQPFSDTIFHYQNSSLMPAYVTKSAPSTSTNIKMERYMDCTWLKEKLEAAGYYSKTSIFETKNHLWVGYGPNRLMFDKRIEKGVYFKDEIFYNSCVFPPLNFMERRGEQLMCHVKSKDIQALKEGMERSGMEAKGKLKKLFELEGDDLQILIFYEFK